MDHNHPDDAPPPYSAVDPLQLQQHVDNNGHEGAHTSPPLETGFSSLNIQSLSPTFPSIAPAETSTISTTDSGLLSEHSAPTLATQFASAAGYFTERSQPLPVTGDIKREILVHHITIYARSHGKDFPRRPRCWNARASEINQHDWDIFLNFLFPSHLNPAASSHRLHRQLRAEIERDRKDRAQETDGQRSARINEVITEWNDYFFASRGVHVTWKYVADLEEGPPSSLCPNCYPQATDISRNRGGLARNDSMNAPIPVSTEQQSRSRTIKRRPVPQNSWGSESSSQTSSAGTEISPVTVSGGILSQGRNQARMAFPERYQSSVPWRSNPMSWAAQMSSIAQQYAARISNQAQDYSRAIEESALARSRQVEMYSRRMEDSALIRGRQLEAMALAKGQMIEQAGDRIANWASNMGRRVVNPLPGPLPTDHSYDQSTYGLTNGNLNNRQRPRSRRQSTASDTSISSISSIDTVSSVSDLEPDDLTSIRSQLSTLDDYHHHELYDAAVSLRSQLEAMKKSRCTRRIRSYHSRWETPEEAANRENRRQTMKRESKLLREKFHEVERRAKREVRDMQKARRETKEREWQERLRAGSLLMSMQSSQSLSRQSRGFPENTEMYKDAQMQAPSASMNRTISEPIHQVAGESSNIPPPSPSIISSQSTASITPATPIDPHEAAKAWTEAQRQRVKEIQKANKERIKEIEKSYKEREKQQRKAMKVLAKRKTTTTPTTPFTILHSSSSASLETGTIEGSAMRHAVNDVAVQGQGSSTSSRGNRSWMELRFSKWITEGMSGFLVVWNVVQEPILAKYK
ncbi:conserved hypothetical protein [Talaromyces stipitatus ATCC 10500]|uniref:Uncharacterized protein n=1 Tax=Talaromyces stipitatus (strain ATCC 10500 / CBS 375.48 / QM 6759 / NRRL 1006) TaxID=441959 RepID=B8LVI3_TALSN|nr:uncharacterized protein TSTA_073880 [Talaromyces stipitatus ATCC 10500]EED24002.1 conserved hypothetical protein [Talaromyces stipitatus ATCC 10500]